MSFHRRDRALRLDALDLHAPARARGLDHRQRDLHDAQPVQAGRRRLAAGDSQSCVQCAVEHVQQWRLPFDFSVGGCRGMRVRSDVAASGERFATGLLLDSPGSPRDDGFVRRADCDGCRAAERYFRVRAPFEHEQQLGRNGPNPGIRLRRTTWT